MMKQQEAKESKRHIHLSLRTKWTIAMSGFILLTFTMFAILFYRNTSDFMMREGEKRLEATMVDLEKRLSKADAPLTADSTTNLLIESLQLPDEQDSLKSQEGKRQVDALVSELAQKEVRAYVFNPQKKLVFQTRPRHKNMVIKPIEQGITFRKVNGVLGFTYGKKIKSKETGKTVGYIQIFYEVTGLYQIKQEIIRNLLLFLAIWCVIVIGFAFVISKYFVRPLQRMTETIEDIKQDPMTKKRTPEPKSHDEIWQLTRLFNNMLDRMQRYISQQEQFVSDVSHELRTPVAIVEGHLNLLNRWGKEDPDILQESLDASLKEIDRMKSLVQEMLDLSRADQAEIQYRNEISYAKEVIGQVVSNFRMIHSDFTFIFDNDLRQEIPIAIYHNHLEQLLIVILDNAVKYSTEEKKVIHISLSSNPQMVEIAIQDFGEGISEEDLTHIFDRFYRVDKARSRAKGGNGLGLSIAKQLVDSYYGEMTVESSLGQGSIFHIRIPIAKEDKE